MTVLYVALGVVFVWLFVVTFLLMRSIRHYKKLSIKTGKHSIDSVLDSLVDHAGKHEKNIDELREALTKLIQDSASFYQKIGFVKFNPFERVGGEQSFVIALLDKNNNGIVKTFLYTREGVRIYVKRIKEGNASEYKLSQEEKEAIQKAE